MDRMRVAFLGGLLGIGGLLGAAGCNGSGPEQPTSKTEAAPAVPTTLLPLKASPAPVPAPTVPPVPVPNTAGAPQPTIPTPAPAAGSTVKRAPESITVYRTRTGKKYHREGCRYLSKSCIPISLEDAVKILAPCSVCNPPMLAK